MCCRRPARIEIKLIVGLKQVNIKTAFLVIIVIIITLIYVT